MTILLSNKQIKRDFGRNASKILAKMNKFFEKEGLADDHVLIVAERKGKPVVVDFYLVGDDGEGSAVMNYMGYEEVDVKSDSMDYLPDLLSDEKIDTSAKLVKKHKHIANCILDNIKSGIGADAGFDKKMEKKMLKEITSVIDDYEL